jgi:hypothetical protein
VGIGNNYPGVGPQRGAAYVLFVGLISQANTKIFQTNPTLAEGDFKVSIDDGAFSDLATLPAVTPAGGKRVKIVLSAAEMEGDNICVMCCDAAGAEWCDLEIEIQTTPGAAQAIELASVSTADVEASATEFETANITEATANHYVGRAVIFKSGVLTNQAATIQAYSLSAGGKGHFTVTPMTEAPANADKFVIV